MFDGFRKEPARPPRRVSAAAELADNVDLQDVDLVEVYTPREAHTGRDRASAAAGGRTERRGSIPQPPAVHQRHMPTAPLKLTIPRKTKENRGLLSYISTESREYEDMMTALTSSYIDTNSAGCFTYCKPRLVNNELLEKEFVEKRREMKAEGRTEKELEESYCFLLADSAKVQALCEKGLCLSQSQMTVLGNPSKGVYLSRYSDLLQKNPLTPGTTGEIIIFKVMKGKVKSIYENIKNLLDPTPRFDSHISKNASKVTSLTSYRAFELTQQYFYEYSFDELRQRPRQVCPYAVISFQMKGKDAPVPSIPLAPVRMNSQSAEGTKEDTQFTVWSGELVKDHRVLFHVSFRSSSPPFLPHKLPDKLEFGYVMRLQQVTKLIPSGLLSYNLYTGSREVEKNGYFCSLLEVIDKTRSTTSVTKLLHELEVKRLVVVIPLTERGFLFLLSSVQMASPAERAESWKRSLQALFVFPQTRDVARYATCRSSSSHHASEFSSSAPEMPHMDKFIPALHHALVKARANPPPELSAGVEQQAREYLSGLGEGKVRHYPMGEYDAKLDEQGEQLPVPKHHRVNMDSYVHCYLSNPAFYLLSVPRARQMMEAHCVAEPAPEATPRLSAGEQRGSARKEPASNDKDKQNKTQKMQQLIDLVLTCKRNAENEVRMEEGAGPKATGKKRKMEQETAERALKFLKASQETGTQERTTGSNAASSSSSSSSPPLSYSSVMGSVGLKDVDLREEGSELASKLFTLLKGLTRAAGGGTNQSLLEAAETGPGESWPFDRLAAKLGLPTNCDIDLRKQDELEEQMAGSVSSSEGFSPGSHSGEMNHAPAAGRGRGPGKKAHVYEESEELIPWILIPITGLCSERYSYRDRNLPEDPRFQHHATATAVFSKAGSPGRSPAPSPPPSPVPSPPPSTSQCPSPDPSPPPSPSQCPSPDPSPPPSPSQCPSPEPSSPPSPQRPLPVPPFRGPPNSPPPSSSSFPLSSSWAWSLEPNKLSALIKKESGANEERLAAPPSRELAGQREEKNEEPSVRPSNPPDPERTRLSPPPTEWAVEEPRTRNYLKQAVYGGEEAELAAEKELMGKVNQLRGSCAFPPSVSSVPPDTRRKIDDIVDKHLGVFSSEMQLLLRGENIHYSFPQSPHSTSATESPTPRHTLPYQALSRFSQYVSFHNPCPPVRDYVNSLQDSMESVVRELDDGWPVKKNADSMLANNVSAFVASVRASGASEDESVAADGGGSDGQNHGRAGGDEAWHRDSNCSSSVTSSVPAAADSPVPSRPQWQPQKGSGVTRAAVARDTSAGGRIFFTADGEGGASSDRTPGLSASSQTGEQNSITSSAPVPGAAAAGPGPPAADLSSLISQLQPEVFSNLVEIMKDVKRNSVLFHLHSTEPLDPADKDVKEHLLKQGNVEKNPVDFLREGNPDSRLLVIIKNKDIAAHVHKIPGLVSLKRHPSVVFVGIDTLDDIRNNSYNELFASGGCIVSDELTLSPDFISHKRLTSLLSVLKQNSSAERVWKWKIHSRTLKKLKEQAKFKREAASLLEVLTAYQELQIVEVLPHHHCDMSSMQSPDLECLIQLQARYTQYRHTVFLTEHRFETFPAYPNAGIVVASIDEILTDFSRLTCCHGIKEEQPSVEDLSASKGLCSALDFSQSTSRPHDPPEGCLKDKRPGDDENYSEPKDVALGSDGGRPSASPSSSSLEPDETSGDIQSRNVNSNMPQEVSLNQVTVEDSKYNHKMGPHWGACGKRALRIQLYGPSGQRWQDDALTDPNVWQHIVCMRVGYVPRHPPYKRWAPNEAVALVNQSTHLATSAIKVEGKPEWLEDVLVSLYSFRDRLWARVETIGCHPNGLPSTFCYLESERRNLSNLVRGQHMVDGWNFQRPRDNGNQSELAVPSSGSEEDPKRRPESYNEKRIQFYHNSGIKCRHSFLKQPKNWLEISYVRVGRVPKRPPFMMWDTSKVIALLNESSHDRTVGTAAEAKNGLLEKVIVSAYTHERGLWAKVEAVGISPMRSLAPFATSSPIRANSSPHRERTVKTGR
ncbi:protein TASOR isoform X2 [Salarias fasciatus]|uniref:protein TASOR isoform X2 n=1 Tax=Salarias fasciatus TaxID=181472 RepID=UPI001176DA45|nr:protein TASOR isoform X2 [Salarias fasciatus]